MISVLILTKNEQLDLPGCLESVAWSDDVHVLDSLSTDRTIEVAREHGAQVTERAFDNWAAHQNWALGNVPFRHPWVFYIDADERVTPELREAIDFCRYYGARGRELFAQPQELRGPTGERRGLRWAGHCDWRRQSRP